MKTNTRYRTHESYPDFVRAALGKSEMPENERSSRHVQEGNSWDGGMGWEKSKQLALEGDLKTAGKISPAILKQANAYFQNVPRPDPVFRVEGGRWIDVARYIKGEPECWGDFEEQEIAPKPGVSIAVHAGVNGGIGAARIERASTQLCSHVLGLQAMGYPVTVFWVDNTRGRMTDEAENHLVVSFPLTQQGRPLDVAHLAAAFQPWFYRRLVFSWFETSLNKEDREIFGIVACGEYGGVEEITAVHLAKVCQGYDRKIFVSIQQAAADDKYIARQIEQQIELATA